VSRGQRRLAAVVLVVIAATMFDAAAVAFSPSKAAKLSVDVTAILPMPDRQLNAMIDEVAALWVPYGVSFTWITTPQQEGLPGAIQTVRVVDDGCRRAQVCAPDETRRSEEPSIKGIGRAIFVEGKTSAEDTLFVSVDRVAHIVLGTEFGGRPVTDWPLSVRADLVGRALGRVLAHELGHYLLGLREHSQDGLMRPLFRTDQLIEPWRRRFELQKTLRPLLRERLEALAARGAG
jgi:hypothetical protein